MKRMRYYILLILLIMINSIFCRSYVQASKVAAPTYTIKKGRTSGGAKCINIVLKKYEGNYVQLYVVKGKKKIQIKISSNNIKKNNKIFRLTYSGENITYKFIIRTYKVVAGKRVYSPYSKEKKISIFANSTNDAGKEAVKSVKIKNASKLKLMKVGDSKKINVSVKTVPNKKKYKKVKYKSSNAVVASVSESGVIKAKKIGKTVITVTSVKNKNKKATIKVTVKKANNALVSDSQQPTEAPILEQPQHQDSSTVENNQAEPTDVPILEQPQHQDSPNVENNQAEQADVPKFIGYKNYAGEYIENDVETFPYEQVSSVDNQSNWIELYKNPVRTIDANDINMGDYLYLKLVFINQKRDNFTEITLDDSDYGKNQKYYSSNDSVNKIESVNTYYDEDKDTYISEVLLRMPKTKNSTVRSIGIKEVAVLKLTTGEKGYADITKALTNNVVFEVAKAPIPSYPFYFDFIENDDGSYTLYSVSESADIPETLYLPDTYNGKKVTKIAAFALEGTRMKTLIIPESIEEIGANMCGYSGAPNLKNIVMLGGAPYLGSFGCIPESQDDKTLIYVPEKYKDTYCLNVSDNFTYYKNVMFWVDEEGNANKYTGNEKDNRMINALKTDKGNEILEAANIANAVPDSGFENLNCYSMSFVDTKYWTDTYEKNKEQSLCFLSGKTEYENNSNGDGLKLYDRDSAQAYVMWDKGYLYVLFDVTDSDIVNNGKELHHNDSTELFLDENNSKCDFYYDEDDVQLRVNASNNMLTAGSHGTAGYAMIAHASEYKRNADNDIIGYQTEYIIKLNSEHNFGDLLGIELKINDCFIPEDSEISVRKRAMGVTDRSDLCHENPMLFGNLLLKK